MRLSTLFILFLCAAVSLEAQQTTHLFQNNGDTLILYSDVPGLSPSEFYKVRVRSKATNNVWQESFSLISRSLWSQIDGVDDGVRKNGYFNHLKDWSHTYTNIEMKGAVEIEISKASGEPIDKAVVHPLAKGIATTLRDGKAYFTMQEPSLVAVDIDGKMDDQNTGNDYTGPPIHTISIFAHPVMDRPDRNDPGVAVVRPGDELPDPSTYETLWFGAGMHHVGREFTVQSFKKYYIPGDAIVYGTFTNLEEGNGKNIKIYGVGTISGDSLTHPAYDPDYPGPPGSTDPNLGTPWKPIGIKYSEYVEVEGVCCSNGAFHAIYLAETLPIKHTSVKWAKVLQWRLNGDGIGNAHLTEDCFIRTQDDGCYVKGDKRRNVFWNDANCATFNLAGMPNADNYSLVIEDNDVLYARNRRGKWVGSRVFSFRGAGQCDNVDVTFKNLRIEDKFVTLGVYHLWSTTNHACLGNNDDYGGGLNGNLVFENIRSASRSTTGYSDLIIGRESNPMDGFTFQNVVIDGTLLQSLDDLGCYNAYVTNMTFNPGALGSDVSLSDLKVDGVTVADFGPDKEIYDIVLPLGTVNVPNVQAIPKEEGAGVTTQHALTLPGTTTINILAPDNVTQRSYTLNFTVSTDSVDVTGMTIENCPEPELVEGRSYQLAATVFPSDATIQTVHWVSSDTTLARVDAVGITHAVAPGTVTITASAGNFSSSCEITLLEDVVTGISIGNCPSDSIPAGETYQMQVFFSPAGVSEQPVTWHSSDTTVARVDPMSGLIKGINVGGARIIVTTDTGGVSDSCDIAISKPIVEQWPFGWVKRTIPGLIEGEDFDEGGQNIAYYDDDPPSDKSDYRLGELVDIFQRPDASNGLVIGHPRKNEWLEYTVDVVEGNYDITFYYYSNDATPGALEMRLDGEKFFTISGTQPQGEWNIRDSLVFKNVPIPGGTDKVLRLQYVDGAGFYIDALKFVETSVIPVSGVTLDNCPDTVIVEGTSYPLNATVSPADATDQSVHWSTSDETVATVNADGLVTAKSGGSATVEVTSVDGGFTSSCTIHVVPKVIPVTGVTITDCPDEDILVRSGHQLSATVSPVDADDQAVTWSSSDSTVVAVNDTGLVTAMSAGDATITVTTNEGGFTEACIVTVIDTTVSNAVGIALSKSGISVYPNPASEHLHVEFSGSAKYKYIKVYNLNGKLLMDLCTSDPAIEIDAKKFTSEKMLFLTILIENSVSSFKVIVD